MKKLVAFAFLALAAGAASAQTAPTVQVSPLGPTSALLSLSAEGRSTRVPDIAMFSAGVVTNGTTAAEALGSNSREMDRVVAALKRAGIADRDIQTSSISLSPRWSNPEAEAQRIARETRQPYVPPTEAPRIIGYEARNSVQVRLRKLGEMGKVIDTLVAAGANEVNGPSFTLDDQKAALDEARTEAVAIGRERAELYARAAGMRVVRLLSMSEGGGYYPVQQVFVTARAERGGYPAPPPPPPAPVSPGELSLGLSLSMQFELAR
jgi:uncharacterized protein YggE